MEVRAVYQPRPITAIYRFAACVEEGHALALATLLSLVALQLGLSGIGGSGTSGLDSHGPMGVIFQ